MESVIELVSTNTYRWLMDSAPGTETLFIG